MPRQASYGNFRVRTNNPDWARATNIFSGEYFVSGDLDFVSDLDTFPDAGSTRIDVHANDEFPAVIYVAGNVTLENVRLNTRKTNGNDPTPRRLQIYMLEENRTFRMTGSEAHVLVAGKGINVEINGNSELYGAVIGGRVTLDNAKLHYDTTLAGISQNGRTAWDILAIKEASGAEATQDVGDPDQAPPPPPPVSDVAQDPILGTRNNGNNAVIPQEDQEVIALGAEFREVIPREEIEEGWEGPECGTCGGAGGGPGGVDCGELGCPGHGPCPGCNVPSPDCANGECSTCGGAGGGGDPCAAPGCPGHGIVCIECGEIAPDCGSCGTCNGNGGPNCDVPGCTQSHACETCGVHGAGCDNPTECGTCNGNGGPNCEVPGCTNPHACGTCGVNGPACDNSVCQTCDGVGTGWQWCGPCGTTHDCPTCAGGTCDYPESCIECFAIDGHNHGCTQGYCWGGPGCTGGCAIP